MEDPSSNPGAASCSFGAFRVPGGRRWNSAWHFWNDSLHPGGVRTLQAVRSMKTSHRKSGSRAADMPSAEEPRPNIAGVAVREEDIEPEKGIRAIAILFRGMAILLLFLMVMQVFFAVTSTVPLSVGVVFADAVRLVIFAGLLWGGGNLAVLLIRSHHDLRATRILTARLVHLVRQIGENSGKLGPDEGTRADRTT